MYGARNYVINKSIVYGLCSCLMLAKLLNVLTTVNYSGVYWIERVVTYSVDCYLKCILIKRIRWETLIVVTLTSSPALLK